MSQKSSTRSRFRMFIARSSGHVDAEGNIKPREKGDTFRVVMALMLALVTIVGAVVAWRSAVAGTIAGDTADNALLASLNLQQATTTSSITVSQNRASHLQYYRNLILAEQQLDQAGAQIDKNPDLTFDQRKVILQPFIQQLDLALAGKTFFNLNYLRADNSYDGDRELADDIAEAAQTKDLDADPQFLSADKYRAQSVAFIATLIILAVSLWFFAVSETIEHRVKYVTALGGLAFLLLGSADAWLIEGGADLQPLYDVSFLVSAISVALVAFGIVAVLIAVKVRKQASRQENTGHVGPVEPVEAKDESGSEGFRRAVTILIASVTLFAAVVGWLQADAGVRNDAAGRDQQRFASEALGTDASGHELVNFEYGTAYRAVAELTVQAEGAHVSGDTAAEARYLDIISQTLKLSEQPAPASVGAAGNSATPTQATPSVAPQLLAPPYYDRNGKAVPDVAAYEADVYLTKRTELTERSNLAGDLNNAWENKANAYIVHLTLLAAALALFGLALSFSGYARPLFVVVGSVITLVTFGSVASVYAQPVTTIPDSAVQAYARGVGLTYQGSISGALSAFNEALAQSPGYATALNARGDAYVKLATTEGYTAAAKDYEAAQSAGKDDAKVAWNLGWVYYLLGRFDDSIKMSQHSLDLDPKQASVRLNLAIAQLAEGKITEAKAAYQEAIDKVTQQVADILASGKKVPPSLWTYLSDSGRDLEGLFFRLDNYNADWIEAPPKNTIADPTTVQSATAAVFKELKSRVTALENTGKAPTGTLSAEIGDLSFGAKHAVGDSDYAYADSFNSPVKEINTKFTYNKMQDGQQVEWKVFLNGVELPEFRKQYEWANGESGNGEQTFGEEFSVSNVYALSTGDYIVEMYVDNQLAQISSFDIQP